MRIIVRLLFPFLVLLAGCTSSGGEPGTTVPDERTAGSEPATTSTGPPPAPLVDRIVILDADGSVVTMDRTGDGRTVMAEDGDDEIAYFQPIWAPDGDRVAFSETRQGFAAVIADGATSTRFETDTNPFYLYWSPTGEELTLLRNSPTGGLQMDLIDIASSEVRNVDTGQPYYYSWSPTGDRLVTHVGLDRIELLDPGAGSVELAEAPGVYQAPRWTEAGIFHVIQGPVSQQLVVTEPGGASQPLALVAGSAIFGTDTEGRRVAIQVFAADNGGVSAALQDVPLLPVNRLNVFDVETAEIAAVTDDAVVAFFWSPDGDSLLVLDGGPERGTLQWSIWRNGDVIEYAVFRPTQSFVRDFLPFFDQYAQSTSLWAPDSSAFVFPGEVEGTSGIWVQPVGADAEPMRISDGSWAAWSPQ